MQVELEATTAKLKGDMQKDLQRTQDQIAWQRQLEVVAGAIILALFALVVAMLLSSSEISPSKLDAAVKLTDSSVKTEVAEQLSETRLQREEDIKQTVEFRSTTHGTLQNFQEKMKQMKQEQDEDIHRLSKQVDSLQSTTWVGSIVITVVVTIIMGFCIFVIILCIRNP